MEYVIDNLTSKGHKFVDLQYRYTTHVLEFSSYAKPGKANNRRCIVMFRDYFGKLCELGRLLLFEIS